MSSGERRWSSPTAACPSPHIVSAIPNTPRGKGIEGRVLGCKVSLSAGGVRWRLEFAYAAILNSRDRRIS